MRVLVVDDSAFMRKIISEMIASAPGFEVVATARDGEHAISQALKHRPDLITLDIEMPRMDGLDALRAITKACAEFAPAVLMCSALTEAGSRSSLEALRLGARDFIAKDPTAGTDDAAGFRRELLRKLDAIGKHRGALRARTWDQAQPRSPLTPDGPTSTPIDLARVRCVVIGASTGGPPALETIFSHLPTTLRVPVIVAQHMPRLFSPSLVERLDRNCPPTTVLAESGMLIAEPIVTIAPGGCHLKLSRVGNGPIVARVVETMAGVMWHPSVDLLFSSAAEIFAQGLLAIQLTGIGDDGLKGAADIRARGGQIIAQSPQSCTVFGMPKAVIDAGLADRVLSPPQIGHLLYHLPADRSQRVPNGDNTPVSSFEKSA